MVVFFVGKYYIAKFPKFGDRKKIKMILEGPFIQFIISLDLVDGIVISSRNNL